MNLTWHAEYLFVPLYFPSLFLVKTIVINLTDHSNKCRLQKIAECVDDHGIRMQDDGTLPSPQGSTFRTTAVRDSPTVERSPTDRKAMWEASLSQNKT